MYCCLCDLQQRHHPTPSCEGCACFLINPNPLRRAAESFQAFVEKISAAEFRMKLDIDRRGPGGGQENIHRGIDYKEQP